MRVCLVTCARACDDACVLREHYSHTKKTVVGTDLGTMSTQLHWPSSFILLCTKPAPCSPSTSPWWANSSWSCQTCASQPLTSPQVGIITLFGYSRHTIQAIFAPGNVLCGGGITVFSIPSARELLCACVGVTF